MNGTSLYQLFEATRQVPEREIVVLQSTGTMSKHEDEAEDIFVGLSEHLVEALTKIMGKPQFNDGAAHPKYPGWFDCFFLAYWKHNGTKYIVLRSSDDAWTISLGERMSEMIKD